jgi:Domain of unknown function (DUF4760)
MQPVLADPPQKVPGLDWPAVPTSWKVVAACIFVIIAAVFAWLWFTDIASDRLTVLATLLLAVAAFGAALVSLLVGMNQIKVTDAIGREQIAMALNAVEMAKKQVESASFASGIPVINDFRNKIETDAFKELRKISAEFLLEGKGIAALNGRVYVCPQIEAVLNEYESIAILVEKGGLDEDLVYNYFSDWILTVFPAAEDILDSNQKQNPTYYENFRKLHQRMMVIEERKNGNPRPTRSQVTEFLRAEASWAAPHTHTAIGQQAVALQQGFFMVAVDDLAQFLRTHSNPQDGNP